MTIQDITKIHLRKAGTPGKNYRALDTDGIIKTWVGQSDGGLKLLGAIIDQTITETGLTIAEAQALFYPLNLNPAGYITTFSESDPIWLADKPDYLTSAIAAATYSLLGHTHTFASLTSIPTTLAGYGIIDAQPLDSDLTSWAAITRASGFDTFVATPNSANLAALLTDEVGSGSAVFQSYVDNKANHNLNIYNALGSSIKTETEPMQYISANFNPVSQSVYFQAVWLPVAQTLTGIKWYQRTAGSYTASNYNGVGLYTYSGGTLTLVASSTNDGNIWTASTNSVGSKAFTSSYVASAGLYFIAVLYSSSAVVTPPAFGTTTNFTNLAQSALDFTNSAKICSLLAAQTSFPATQAMSGTTGNTIRFWLGLY